MFRTHGNDAEQNSAVAFLTADENGSWVVPAELAIFTAEFSRDGRDLLLQTHSGGDVRLLDYFSAQTTPDLTTSDGATLRGATVEKLAGPLFAGQYAQAGGVDLASAIGQVETLDGRAFVQRTDGSTEELLIGVKVFEGDVVRTEGDSTLSLTFADGTIFTLASGSRMVLDELIYDPDSTSNSGVFDLVEGSFVFIAGQAAKTGGIEINTPAATMGIRGTTGLIDIQTVLGVLRVVVSLNVDPDGGLGVIQLFDLGGELIANLTSTETKWIIAPPVTGEPPIEVPRSAEEITSDSILLNQAAAAFQAAITRVANGETFVEFSEAAGEGQNAGEEEGEGEEGNGGSEPIVPPPLDETGEGQGAGESGTGNPELDGTDEPLPEGNEGGGGDDDASLNGPSNPVQTANNAINRPPEFGSDPIQSVEDTAITGVLPVSDREGDTIEVSLTRGAQNGLVVLSTDGTFTYTPNPDFEGTDTFEVTAMDSEGGTSEAEITVVVDGVNDAPVVTEERQAAATSELPEGEAPVDTVLSGVLIYQDVDEGDAPGTWTIAAAAGNATALGTASIDPNTGAWTYVLSQTSANILAEGQQVTETFIATITDADGATDSAEIAISITGTNDTPILTSSVESTEAILAEAAFGFVLGETDDQPVDQSVPGSATGTLTYEDADAADAPGTWSIVAAAENTTVFGAMVIDAATGTWVYTLDEAAADVLGNGDESVEVFNATITDANGATATQAVTITITGFNDAPTITFSIEDIQATVYESGFVVDTATFGEAATAEEADASGHLRYVDPDGNPNDAVTWSISPDGPSLGEMTIDPETGEWHYCLDEDAAQGLQEGEEVVETFTAVVTDSQGASSSQVITITVIGSNDEAEIVADADDLGGSVEEGGISTASGQLGYEDPDANPEDTAEWSVAPFGDVRGSMTIDPVTGEWSYTLDQASAQDLGENQTDEDIFVASITDSLGAIGTQFITITLTGQNDAPVVTSSAVSETVIEAGDAGPGIPGVNGTLTYTDVDQDGTSPFWSLTPDPANTTVLGTMSLNASTGEWSYTLDQAAADYLQNGDMEVEKFTATITDAFGASDTTTITITIEGRNDTPVISAATAGLDEEDTEVRIDLETLGSDVDAGEDGSTLIYAIVSGPAAGNARLDGNELVFETAGAFTGLALNETQDVEIEVSATDGAGASDRAIITVTVTGSNGAPTLEPTSRTVDEDEASLAINLAALGDDPDADENGSTLDYDITGGPGFGSAQIVGTVLTFFPGDDFEDLGVGESRDVAIEVTATDDAGETATADMTITVTGSNDAPVVTSNAAAAEGDVTEPGNGVPGSLTTGGTLTYSDSDETAPGQGIWSISPASSSLGQITIGAGTGIWQYTLDPAAADSLADGDVRTETFTARITDQAGDSDTQTVTVTINGTNDAPTVSPGSATMAEDEVSVQVDLSTLGADVDAGETGSTLNYAIISGPASGSAGLVGDVLTFSVGNDFTDLGQGEERDVTIRVRATDSEGATGEGLVTITVTGKNDAPEITSSALAAQGEVTEPGEGVAGSLTTGGTLTYVDPDASSPTAGNWSVNPTSAALGSISINAKSGVWSYVLDPAAADSFDEGDELQEIFTATIEDEHGATDTQEITVTINGTNDAPELTAATSNVSEDDTFATIALAGLADDVDADDTDATLAFRIISNPSDGSASISGSTLRFNLGSDFEDLAEGQIREVTVGVEVRDRQGDTDTANFVFRVEGTNDAPVITSSAAAARGTVTEAGVGTAGVPQISGQLAYFDVDETDPNQGDWSVTPGSRALGSISINQTSGLWTYTLNQAAADVLNAGEVRTETFTATVEDVEGATDSETITITIRGTNDAPTLASASRTVTEDTSEVAINLDPLAADPDGGDPVSSLTYQVISQPSDGSATIVGRTLEFSTDGDFDDLAPGEERIVTAVVRVRDDSNASEDTTFSFTVTGVNDAPVVTSTAAAATGNVTEEGTGIGSAVASELADATGMLTYEDADERPGNPAQWSVTTNGTGHLGRVEIDPDSGEWSYFLNESLADSLIEGEPKTETFTAKITDEFGAMDTQIITINITGTNDAPVVLSTSDSTGNITEGTDTEASGQIRFRDVDDFTLPPTWTIAPVGGFTPAYGTMSISQTGQWTYTVDPDKIAALMQGERDGETFRVRITDEFGASDTTAVSVNFIGVNTAPVNTSDPAEVMGQVVEVGYGVAGTATAMGTLSYDDPDEGETSAAWEITPDGATPLGSIQIDEATGKWTYTLDAAKSDALNDGQMVTETFQAVARDVFNATSSPQTITVKITGSNDAPDLDQGAPILADPTDPTEFDLRAVSSDADAEHDPADLTFVIVTGPAMGIAVISNGTLVFTPGDDFADLAGGSFEDVTVRVRVSDPLGAFTEHDLTLRVQGENDPPEIDSDPSESMGEISEQGFGTEYSNTVSGQLSFTDPDGDFLGEGGESGEEGEEGEGAGWSISPHSSTYGSIEINSQTGEWTYRLNQDAADELDHGDMVTENFTAKITDPMGAFDTEVISIKITGTNDRPTLATTTVRVSEDGPGHDIDLTALGDDPDADEDGDDLTYALVSSTAPAGAAGVSAGVLTFNPGSHFHSLADGDEQNVTVRVSATDGMGASVQQNMTIIVEGKNDAPEADDFAVTYTGSGGSQAIDALAHVMDVDNLDVVSLDLVNTAGAGTVIIHDGGTPTDPTDDVINYTPAAGFIGTEVLTYTVSDEDGEQATGEITVTVPDFNDPPTVGDDVAKVALAGPEGTWQAFGGHYYRYVGGIRTWSEASDLATDEGGYLATISSAGENAFIDGLFGQTVAWIGASDAASEGAWHWVTGPEAGTQFWQGASAGDGGVPVGANYTNWDGTEPFLPRSAEQDFAVIRNGSGKWDDLANDPIEMQNGFYPTAGHIEERDSLTMWSGNVGGNDSDPQGDAITFQLSGSYAGLQMASNGYWTFDITNSAYDYLDDGEFANLDATYIATDAQGASATGTLRLEIEGVNNAPEVTPIDAGSVAESAPTVTIDLLDGQTDPDDNDTNLMVTNFSYNWSGDGPSPTISGPVDGKISVDPSDFITLDDGEMATLTVNYKVSDGTVAVSNTATLKITGESAEVIARDDNLLFQTMNVVILGSNGAEFEATRDQLLDSYFYDFNITSHKAGESQDTGYWNGIFSAADVILVGGEATPSPALQGQNVWLSLSDAFDAGIPVVTTGHFPAYIGEFPQSTNAPTVDYLDNVSPVGRPQTTLYADNTVDILSSSHPITDGVGDFSLPASDWSLSHSKDATAVNLANGSAPGPFGLLYDDSGSVHSAYVGGRYLGGNGSLNGLRTGEADQLLEQALHWAADNDATHNTDEDTPFTINLADLIGNDSDGEGGAVSIVSIDQYSAAGASVSLSGSLITYDPTTSATLENLGAGAIHQDSFTYIVRNTAGTQTDTGTVTLGVLGLAPSGDADPVLQSGELRVGFESGTSRQYFVSEDYFKDTDGGGSGQITYKFGSISPDGPLPDYLQFDPTSNLLSVDMSVFDGPFDQGTRPLFLTAFEEDGDYSVVPVKVSINSDGVFRFAVFDDETLEFGTAPGTSLGPLAEGVLIDLSGVDSAAPGTLDGISEIDIANRQANELVIDPDDLLALIDGNAPGSQEDFTLRADAFDDVSFAESGSWSVELVGGSSDLYGVTATDLAGGQFAAFEGEGVFATFFIDDTHNVSA